MSPGFSVRAVLHAPLSDLLTWDVLGILLVDPTTDEGFPLWGGYRNFENCPSLYAASPSVRPPRTSLFEDTIYWTLRMSAADIQAGQMDPKVLGYRTCQIICAEWLTLCQYITARLGQIEW